MPIILLTLAAGQFLMTLDTSVMNVAIATVAEDVGTDVTGIQTAITLYTLVMAALMITGGKVGGADRAQARVHDRLRDLRRGLVHDVDRAVAARPDPRLVVPGGRRRGADPAGDRRARGRELRPGGPSAGLRPGDGGRRGGRRRRPGHRRAVHHVPELALRVRGRGPDRPRDPRARAPDGGRARRRAPEDRRPRRRAVGRRPRSRGLRRPALERVGLGVTRSRTRRSCSASPRRCG